MNDNKNDIEKYIAENATSLNLFFQNITVVNKHSVPSFKIMKSNNGNISISRKLYKHVSSIFITE